MPTYTRSVTSTVTTTRLGFLKTQVRIALRRSMHYIAEETLQRVFDLGLSRKYIGQIDVFGLDYAGLCRAQLKIKIDWNKHQIYIQEGRDMITVPESWMDIGAIEVDEMTRLFREFVDDEELSTIWQIYWADGVNAEKARQELGTVHATAPTWRGRPNGITSSVSLADEMCIGCYFAG